ncbi:hypothetical protein ACWCQW_35795 [Streptomyces mirabilis]
MLDLTSISAEAIAATRTTIAKASGVATADIVVTVTHTFSAPHVQATTSSPVPVWILQLGNGVFVGVEPELSTDTALAVKKHSPFPHTAVMSMLEGGSKNMAEAQSYARVTYEAMDSSYAQGSAETVAAKIGTLLHSLRA